MSVEKEENKLKIPHEIVDELQSFHENFKKMENILHPLTQTNVNSLDIDLPPLDRARLNLISGYALNALYWMYLNTIGENPKEHGIKSELERYKSFMQSVKEISDKDKAPALNKSAAKRFVRNALWEPNDKDAEQNLQCSSQETTFGESSVSSSESPVDAKNNFRKKKRRN